MKLHVSRPLISAVFASGILACSGAGNVATGNEIVLCPGASVSVVTPGSRITIASTSLMSRRVQVDETKQEIAMTPRRERWYGGFGLEASSGNATDDHVTAEEGYQYFDPLDELLLWLEGKRKRLSIAYTESGLVVAWLFQKRPEGFSRGPNAALTVEIWQLWAKGEKPTRLAGADPQAFSTLKLPDAECSKPEKYLARAPAVVGGRAYSGRALDFLSERGQSTAGAEAIIRNGRGEKTGSSTTYFSESGEGAIFFVEVASDGKVTAIG